MSRVIGKNPLPEPLIARIARGAEKAGGSTLPYSWDEDYPARIGLLPREGAEPVRWFDIDPCYIFHTLNAYEEGDAVVIDCVRHPKMFATDFTGPNEGVASLARFTLDLTSGKAREDRLDEHGQEFPRHDERRTGQRHRYGYSVGFNGPRPGDSVLKHDVVAGTTQARALGAGREAGEFCFVPSADDSAEGEGILMGYVHDRSSGLSDLVLLDAGTLEDVAAVHLPGRVPTGFHGNWIPTSH